MNPSELSSAIQRYNERLELYGPTEKALGWGDKGRSALRFEILISQWQLDQSEILDVGCGFGDLYGLIARSGILLKSYVGMDINPKLLEVGRIRYAHAAFVQVNLEDDVYDTQADYVFASGLFNFKLENSDTFVHKMFERFDKLSRKGFAANFLSDKVDYKLEHTYHADPAGILNLAYKYSRNVVLRNDYMPFEFTVFVNKAAKIDPATTVYEDYVSQCRLEA